MNQDNMTAKEMMDKIVDGIPKSVYEGTTEEMEIKLALYVYITLAKEKSFDERVYWGDVKLAYRVVQESKKDSKDMNKLAEKRKLTCISLANLYKKILNRLGIQCDVVRLEPPDEHLSNIITLKSGRKISADVQLDLYSIHTGMRLSFFEAVGKENFLNQDILTKYLIDLGYISSEKDYRDNAIVKTKIAIERLADREALAYVMGNDEIFEGMSGIETSEAYRFYRAVRMEVFYNERDKKIYQIPCYRVGKNRETRDFTFCIFSDTGNYRTVIPYLYSIKQGRMLYCDLETLGELQKSGLQLGNSKFSRGGRKIKKYIKDANIGRNFREDMGFER